MIARHYIKVDSLDLIKEMIAHIKDHELISFDTETNSLNPRKGKIIGFSVSGAKGLGYYMPTMLYVNGELLDAKVDDILCHDIAKKVIALLVGKKLIGHNL